MAENRKEKGMIAKLGMSQAAPPWGLGEASLALAILLVGTLIIGTGVTATVSTSTTNPDPISFVMGWFIGLVVVLVFVLVRWRRHKNRFDALTLKNEQWHPFLAVLVGIGGGFLASLIAGIGSGDFLAPLQVLGIVNNDLGALALVALLVLIVQPIAEGLVFWGVNLPRWRASLGSWAGLLVTVGLYAAYYYLVFGSRATGSIAIWHGIIYPIIVGVCLAAVRIWSKSTLSAILAHVAVGASVIIIMIVI